jgi:glycine/D-amino acid oxidase-like deaminating enzyme
VRKDYDLVIVGGGIIGASTLFNLLNDGYSSRIRLFERLDAVAQASTALSAGGCRNLWSTEINQRLTTYSINKFRRFKEEIGRSIGFEPCGYLFTFYEGEWQRIVEYKPNWDRVGVRSRLLSPKEVERLVPGLITGVEHIDPEIRELAGLEPIVGGLFGEDCGTFDPTAVAQAYFEQVRENFGDRAQVTLRTEVARLVIKADQVLGVELTSGEIVGADKVLVAAGAYSGQLLERSELSEADNLPIHPLKRMLFVANLPETPGFDSIPMTIIDKGIYFRFEAGNLLIGRAKPDQVPGFDTTPEPNYYKEEVNPYMQERIPGTEHCNIKNLWGGLYCDNYLDHNAIVGAHSRIKGLYLATGFSGHGVMEAPAIGKGLSELINFGEYRTIDLSVLSMDRFKNNQLVLETIVI